LISELKVTNQTIPTFDEVQIALKEVAYSYYMRGKYIQYNSIKKEIYPPEEATSQKINNIVCSHIIRNVYKELLNITTPEITEDYAEYASNQSKRPEVVAFTPSLNNKATEIIFNFPNLKENKTNPTYRDIVHHLQPGDILVYVNNNKSRDRGHTMMVLDVIDNKKDALILESTDENLSIVNTKFAKFPLYFGKVNNTFGNFPKEEGSLRIKSLSKIDKWKNMNQLYKELIKKVFSLFVQRKTLDINLVNKSNEIKDSLDKRLDSLLEKDNKSFNAEEKSDSEKVNIIYMKSNSMVLKPVTNINIIKANFNIVQEQPSNTFKFSKFSHIFPIS